MVNRLFKQKDLFHFIIDKYILIKNVLISLIHKINSSNPFNKYASIKIDVQNKMVLKIISNKCIKKNSINKVRRWCPHYKIFNP